MLGFPTKKAARAAVGEIINAHGLEQQFFHPLLLRLFVEHPYKSWIPNFSVFKWTRRELLTGAMTDRWLMGFSLETDWVNTSINKCFDPPKEYEIFAEIAHEAASQAALPVPASSDAQPSGHNFSVGVRGWARAELLLAAFFLAGRRA
jgi:hypothetical protein